MSWGGDWEDGYGHCDYCTHCQNEDKASESRLSKAMNKVEEFEKKFPRLMLRGYGETRADFCPIDRKTRKFLPDSYIKRIPDDFKGIKIYLEVMSKWGSVPCKPSTYLERRKEYEEYKAERKRLGYRD
jgi:hypothetical protein